MTSAPRNPPGWNAGWVTIQEIVHLVVTYRVEGYPRTDMGMYLHSESAGWEFRDTKAAGRRGALREYRVGSLPDVLQLAAAAARRDSGAPLSAESVQDVRYGKRVRNSVAIKYAAPHWKNMTIAERQTFFERLPPEKQEAARVREQIVLRWLQEQRAAMEGESNGMTAAAFCEWASATYGTTVTKSNLWVWVEKYRKFQIYGLVDSRGRRPGQRFRATGWVAQYIENVWMAELGNVKANHLWVALHAKAFNEGKIPSFAPVLNPNLNSNADENGGDWKLIDRSSIARYLKHLREKHAGFLKAMNSPDKFDSACEPAFGSACEDITHTNQRWEIDASPLDIMAFRPVWGGERKHYRYALISIVDRYSRMCVMDIAETSNILSVARLLWLAVESLGLPEEIVVDNGKEYVSEQIQAGFRALGIWVITARPFKGKDKPFVERIFGTFQTGFSENMPGFIGHSVAQRVEIEARVPKSERLSGRGTQLDTLDIDDIRARMAEWLGTVYPHTYNKGLKATPAEAYRTGLTGEPRTISREQFMFSFGERKTVTITNKGVRWQGIQYQSPELGSMIGEKATLVLDLDDIHRGYVFRQDGTLACVVRNANAEPLTAEERKQARRIYGARKRQYREAAKFARENLAEDGDRVAAIITASQKEMEKGGFDEAADMARSMPVPARSGVDALIEASQREKLAKLKAAEEAAAASELRGEIRTSVPDLTAVIDLANKRKEQEAEKGSDPKKLTLADLMGIKKAVGDK